MSNKKTLTFKNTIYDIIDNGDIGNGWKYVEILNKKQTFSLPKCLYYKGKVMKDLLTYTEYIGHLDVSKDFMNDFVKDIFRECYPGSKNPVCKVKNSLMIGGGDINNPKLINFLNENKNITDDLIENYEPLNEDNELYQILTAAEYTKGDNLPAKETIQTVKSFLDDVNEDVLNQDELITNYNMENAKNNNNNHINALTIKDFLNNEDEKTKNNHKRPAEATSAAATSAAAPAEAAPSAEEKPAEDAAPAAEEKPAEEAAPAAEEKPAEEAAPAEAAPAEEAAPAAEEKPAEEAAPAEAAPAAEEAAKPAEAAPAAQEKPAEGFLEGIVDGGVSLYEQNPELSKFMGDDKYLVDSKTTENMPLDYLFIQHGQLSIDDNPIVLFKSGNLMDELGLYLNKENKFFKVKYDDKDTFNIATISASSEKMDRLAKLIVRDVVQTKQALRHLEGNIGKVLNVLVDKFENNNKKKTLFRTNSKISANPVNSPAVDKYLNNVDTQPIQVSAPSSSSDGKGLGGTFPE